MEKLDDSLTTPKTYCEIINRFRSSLPETFSKKGVLKTFTNFTGKHLCQSLFLNKVAGLMPEILAQMFFCEFCEIFENMFFYRTPPVATSGVF